MNPPSGRTAESKTKAPHPFGQLDEDRGPPRVSTYAHSLQYLKATYLNPVQRPVERIGTLPATMIRPGKYSLRLILRSRCSFKSFLGHSVRGCSYSRSSST